MVDADLGRNGLGRAGVVARHHPDLLARRLELRDDGGRLALACVGDAERAEHDTAARDAQLRLGLRAQIRQRGERGRVDAQLIEPRPAAADDGRARDRAAHAAAEFIGKVLHLRQRRVGLLLRIRRDGARQRVVRALLERGGEPHERLRLHGAARADVRERRRAVCERAGLVKDDAVGLVGVFELRAALEEDAVLRRAAGADHEPRRCGEAERARARDRQHVAAGEQRALEIARRNAPVPDEKRQCRRADDARHEPARDLIGKALHGRFFALGLPHDLNDLLEHGRLAQRLGRNDGRARAVEAAADDLVAGGLVHRHALAGEHGLVDRAPAADDRPVDRHALAGADAHPVVLRDLVDRQLNKRVPALDHGCARLQVHESADGGVGLPGRDLLHILAEEDEREQHPVGRKVELVARARRERHVSAVEIDERGRERDEEIHAERAVARSPPRTLVKIPPGAKLQRRSGQELQLRVHLEHERRRTAGRGHERFEQVHALFELLIRVAAAQLAERDGAARSRAGGSKVAPVHAEGPEVRCERAVRLHCRILDAEHRAQRVRRGSSHFRVRLRREQILLLDRHAKARTFDPRRDRGEIGHALVVGDERRGGGVVHRRALHAGQLFQRTVQPCHARGALHVQNSQRNVFHLLRPQVKKGSAQPALPLHKIRPPRPLPAGSA